MRLNLPPLEGMNPDHTSRRDERRIIAAALREWADEARDYSKEENFVYSLEDLDDMAETARVLADQIDPDKEKE